MKAVINLDKKDVEMGFGEGESSKKGTYHGGGMGMVMLRIADGELGGGIIEREKGRVTRTSPKEGSGRPISAQSEKSRKGAKGPE